MTMYPENLNGARRRHLSARQFAGLTLAAIGISLLCGFLDMQDSLTRERRPETFQPTVEFRAQDIKGWREAWAVQGEKARLLVEPEGEGRWVCARIAGRAHQPLCRRFASDLLGVCHEGSHFQLVLANGDIHRVDHALLDADGSFTPVHHPEQSLILRSAWIPSDSCYPGAGSAEIIAVDHESNLLHFDGKGWHRIDQLHSLTGLTSESPAVHRRLAKAPGPAAKNF